MANFFPSLEIIDQLTVKPTEGESFFLNRLAQELDDTFDVYFNPYLDGDRPDFLILKKGHGAIIIEVKDWDMSNYFIDKNNHWRTNHNPKIRTSAPMQQAFKYKSHLFELHIPSLGFSNILNSNFYKTIQCFVYLHTTTKDRLSALYDRPINEVKQLINSANGQRYSSKKYQLERDRFNTFAQDNISSLITKINNLKKNPIFQDHIYNDFTKILIPPKHLEEQGHYYTFDKYQNKLLDSIPNTKMKIRGVAGSGKTTLLAEKTARAFKRHNSTVLVLTYNLALRNLIRDKIKKAFRFNDLEFDNKSIEISNYHYFFKSQLNNLGIPFPTSGDQDEDLENFENNEIFDLDFQEKSNAEIIGLSSKDLYEIEKNAREEKLVLEDFFERVFKTDLFKEANEKPIKYQTIFIDEVQDFEVEWLEIIIYNFLAEDGEMVLFGDQNQNIYNRLINKQDYPVTRGFGHWKNLKISHRQDDKAFADLCNAYKDSFLKEYPDQLEHDVIENLAFSFSDKKYLQITQTNNIEASFSFISNIIKNLSVSPNDIAILSSKIDFLRNLQNNFKFKKTDSTFETPSEYEMIQKNFDGKVETFLKKKAQLEEKLHSCHPSDINHIRSDIQKLTSYMKNTARQKLKALDEFRKLKKRHFNANSGLMKIATTHSFKGFEADTTFLIIQPNDSPEIVYAGLTRAANNLYIIDLDTSNVYKNFFEKQLS
ncbi:nuclease-related domain-containing DEAD/DEAH box helicase [Acinetobacter johnsonii]|uniref:nuclease-related domain-containing DEAD/DEAH box helicase n=1 Tax=Acinetobacter johnsonii TaxID=40214 RepID=UPI0032B3940E